jgi:hypothetical protein
MNRQQMHLALLKMTLVLLLGSTWIFVGFLFESQPERPTRTIENALTSLVRLPASLPAGIQENVFSGKPRPPELPRMDVLELACWDRGERPARDTNSRWVRLKGGPCDSGKNTDQVTVRNMTNGYLATVFTHRGPDWTTDFIPLQAGPNEIRIRFEQGAGVTLESQFTLRRE